MTCRGWVLQLGLCGLAPGCGPSAGAGDSGHSGSGGSTTDTDSASATSAGTSSTGASTTASTDTGVGTSDGSGSTTGGGTCPPPDPVTASFEVTTNVVLFGGMDVPCVADNVTSMAESSTVYMTCSDGPDEPIGVTLTYGSTGHIGPLFGKGEQLLLSYREDSPGMGVDQWFALRIAGEQPWLVAAGVLGTRLDLTDMTFSEFLGQPSLVANPGTCPLEDSDCGPLERLRLDLGYDGQVSPVVAPGIGYAGRLVSYRLAAEEATRYEQVQCLDVWPDWYDLIIESVPEG